MSQSTTLRRSLQTSLAGRVRALALIAVEGLALTFMAREEGALAPEASLPTAHANASSQALPPHDPRRLLIFCGLLLIIVGMVFGDIFAVFVLHQNAGRIGEHLLAATDAVSAGDAAAAQQHILRIGGPGGFLENRGTKVDTHVHIIAFGYIALLLALLLPYVALTNRRQLQLARLFAVGATLLPVSVFLIYYVGVGGSPLASQGIGWASILADFGGLLVIVACAGFLVGLWRHGRSHPTVGHELLPDRSWSSRALLAGGTFLVLLGFLHGAYYAGIHLYEHEQRDVALLASMLENAAAQHRSAATNAVMAYGGLQGERAVHIAAHAHLIEFGTLALLLAFIQPFVFLSERWRRRWTVTLLIGSLGLPVFVLLELRWGLFAGGLADMSGLLVIIALTAMLVGVLRHTGKLDAAEAEP